MRKLFATEEKPDTSEIIDSCYESVDKFNEDIVNIHCSLTNNIDSLEEFRIIQTKLDELTNDFYTFDNYFEESFEEEINKYRRLEKTFKLLISLSLFCILLPPGLILVLAFLFSNYVRLKVVRNALEDLDSSYDELERKCQIIKNNIRNKYSLLNKRIKEYATNTKIEGLNLNEDYTYYYAIQIINSYLDGFDITLDNIDSNIELAIKNILQEDLQSESTDLMLLLNLARENNKQDILVRKKDN